MDVWVTSGIRTCWMVSTREQFPTRHVEFESISYNSKIISYLPFWLGLTVSADLLLWCRRPSSSQSSRTPSSNLALNFVEKVAIQAIFQKVRATFLRLWFFLTQNSIGVSYDSYTVTCWNFEINEVENNWNMSLWQMGKWKIHWMWLI